jgi:hypothetical protein
MSSAGPLIVAFLCVRMSGKEGISKRQSSTNLPASNGRSAKLQCARYTTDSASLLLLLMSKSTQLLASSDAVQQQPALLILVLSVKRVRFLVQESTELALLQPSTDATGLLKKMLCCASSASK